MCGRFSLFQTDEKGLLKRFRALKFAETFRLRYNIAPSQNVYAVLGGAPDIISSVRWGLIPSWAKDSAIGNMMINARADTLTQKPAYKGPVRSKRCLIIADGFYEWKKEGSAKKRPFRVSLKDDTVFAFAGLWDRWENGNAAIVSCSIITTTANALVGKIHDRMPVILRPEDEQNWILEKNPDSALKLLAPYDPDMMKAFEISTLVNSPANDDPGILKAKSP